MSRSKSPPDRAHKFHCFAKPVSYQWILPDGTVCHSHTVVLSRTRAGLRNAVRRFWLQNTHVAPEAA